MVLPFDGCLEPGDGDELAGCLCGAPGPLVVVVVVVVVVVGVVLVLVVLGPVVVPVVVPVVGVVSGAVVVVVVVVVVVGGRPCSGGRGRGRGRGRRRSSRRVELVRRVVGAEQPATTRSTALGFGNAGVGSSAASAAPSVGTGSLAGISNGIAMPPGNSAVTHCWATAVPAGTVAVVVADATGIAHRQNATGTAINQRRKR